jgi:hypothetical protein
MPKQLSRILRSLLLVLTIGLLPLISLWRTNLGQLANSALTTPFLLTLAFILTVWGITWLITRSLEKAALFGALTSIFAFTFGDLYNIVGQKTIFGISIGYFKLLLAWLIAYALLAFLIFSAKKFSSSTLLILNVIGVALLAFNSYPAVVHGISQMRSSTNPKNQASATPSQNTRPDVYYIVLDSYARADILQQLFSYDNSAFIDGLKSRGFYIPDCAFSNYDGTTLTISSVLNMDYLDALHLDVNNIDQQLTTNNNVIINNKVMEVFHQLGYKVITGRGYNSTLDINNADIYLNYFQNGSSSDNLDEQRFSSLYFNTTILRVFSELYRSNPARFSWLPYWLAVDRESDGYLKEASFWYYQNNYMFDSLAKVPEMPGNYLVYAHINAPHGPYVFRADGSFRYPLDTSDEKVLYADTITYLNKRILALVDTLQSKSSVPPIIILQADHDIHMLTTGLDKHKILSAYYLPGVPVTPPYATITPVNDFRLILKDYFDPNEALLPDTLYVKYTNDYEAVPSSCKLGTN